MATVGQCDCCGEMHKLHLAGEYLVCDSCELVLRGEEE